ncbi:peptidase M42 [Flavonifractor sp. An92]|uniref:M42 family peptidase n=1 Tax=Flavonifractor sp. An92 TaxID=1965666 RepID=UPI000B3838EA|nr:MULTISPECIES: M42 family peptidase [unclassified Flavonifractor]OUN07903.1 peptidase M42 [Flavonifractor sp. An92]OUQ24766.1 peptidase M42 [Flavonifractor sp. An135]
MDSLHTLEALCAQNAPSGFEGPAARTAAGLLAPLMDQVTVDRMGNVIGVRRCGKPGAKRLLLDAHLDEIGLIVTGVEDGFLRFQTIGGVDPRMLPDREVTVLTEPPLFGVVACLPPHVQKKGDENRSVPIDELFVDIGMDQETAEKTVPIGTPMVFRGGCFPLSHGKICGKAMDDRSCFTALVRCAELLRGEALDVDLYIMGSTREEISGAGALCATFALEPDCCVAVDVTHGATPDAPKDKCFTLGGGPAIGVGPNMTGWMTRLLCSRAEAAGIPYDLEVMGGHTGTNAWEMQICREGVATAVVSLPLRYMHSPIEVLDSGDLEQTARLLASFVRALGKEGDLC